MKQITSPLPVSQYKTRISSTRKEGDAYRGIVCCSPGGIDHPDYVEIEWPELAATEDEAMSDAGKVQFALDEQPAR